MDLSLVFSRELVQVLRGFEKGDIIRVKRRSIKMKEWI